MGLAIQFAFELRPDSRTRNLSVEYTVDRETKTIAQWAYFSNQMMRAVIEPLASKDFFSADDRDVMDSGDVSDYRQLAIVSFIAMISTRIPRWDTEWMITNMRLATMTTYNPSASRGPCTAVSIKSIAEQLNKNGNVFSSLLLDQEFDRDICLPPNSKLFADKFSVTITTRSCQLVFAAGDFLGGDNTDPRSSGPMPLLANGKPRFSSTSVGLTIKISFFWWLSQSHLASECRDWSHRVGDEASDWFKQVTLAEYRRSQDRTFLMPLFSQP